MIGLSFAISGIFSQSSKNRDSALLRMAAMTKRGEPLPINQALNRPRAKLGLDLSAWMATSADRNWAALYQPADVLYYTRGSKELGIERGTYATVISTDPKANQLTVEREDGQQVTYDPKRLHGIAAYREIDRDFAQGDRIQFTANNRTLAASNRDLGTIERIDGNQICVKMDGAKERTVGFDAGEMGDNAQAQSGSKETIDLGLSL